MSGMAIVRRALPMIHIELTPAQAKDINEAMDDPSLGDRHRIKLLVIRMHAEGGKHGFIAKSLKLHHHTITNYLKEYRAGGLPAEPAFSTAH